MSLHDSTLHYGERRREKLDPATSQYQEVGIGISSVQMRMYYDSHYDGLVYRLRTLRS